MKQILITLAVQCSGHNDDRDQFIKELKASAEVFPHRNWHDDAGIRFVQNSYIGGFKSVKIKDIS